MALEYSQESRETDNYALPDIEVWHSSEYPDFETEDGEALEQGFYYWACFPGCLPDSDPFGPFETYEEALQDAREQVEEW